MKITDEMLSAAAPKARDLLLDSLPADMPNHDASPEFHKKMETLHRKYKCIRLLKQTARVLQKTAAILLILLGIASAGVLTVAAVQGKALDLIIHIYKEYIVYESPSYPGREVMYEELYPIKLGWLPYHMDIAFENLLKDGTDHSIALRNADQIPNMGYANGAKYKGAKGELQRRLIRPGDDFIVAFTTEGAQHETFVFGEFTADVYIKDDLTTIRWFDQNIFYELYGDFGTETLKKVAENIIFYK